MNEGFLSGGGSGESPAVAHKTLGAQERRGSFSSPSGPIGSGDRLRSAEEIGSLLCMEIHCGAERETLNVPLVTFLANTIGVGLEMER